MNDIETARAHINQRVAEYIDAHSETTYSSMARALGVSRWRVQTGWASVVLKTIAGLSMVSLNNSFFSVHYWGAFCTVVLLGVIQILLAYYNSHITIESLPESVSSAKRLRYRRTVARTRHHIADTPFGKIE